jgi:hypothetical protein
MASWKIVTCPLFSAGVMWTSAASRHAVAAEMTGWARIHRHAQRGLPNMHEIRPDSSRGSLQDQIAALHRHGWEENTVGQVLEAIQIAAQADFALDRFVIRRDILVVDRPVLAGAIVRAPLEVALAEPQRHRIPQHRLAAHAAASLRIESFFSRSHRRDLTGGEVEGERVRVEVGARIHTRTALNQGDTHSTPRKVRGERAARRAGADDDDIERIGLHH